MLIAINGKGMQVSDYMKEVVETRLGKLGRYFREDTEAQVLLSMLRGRQIVEITIPFGGVVLRAEEATGDFYASLDNVCKKLERQIVRHRTKLGKRLHESAFRKPEAPVFLDVEEESAIISAQLPRIVKTKRFAIKPMNIEEAAMQMDLLDHTFYVFFNADSQEVNVLYLRNDGDYGLIEPEYN